MRRKSNEERHMIIREETQKLLNAGHIREIQYSEWLANMVLVQKANRKWRMCVEEVLEFCGLITPLLSQQLRRRPSVWYMGQTP